jgi:hypothetical protein
MEGQIVPEGLSVTRTPYSEFWWLKIGRHRAMVRVPLGKRPRKVRVELRSYPE